MIQVFFLAKNYLPLESSFAKLKDCYRGMKIPVGLNTVEGFDGALVPLPSARSPLGSSYRGPRFGPYPRTTPPSPWRSSCDTPSGAFPKAEGLLSHGMVKILAAAAASSNFFPSTPKPHQVP